MSFGNALKDRFNSRLWIPSIWIKYFDDIVEGILGFFKMLYIVFVGLFVWIFRTVVNVLIIITFPISYFLVRYMTNKAIDKIYSKK